MAKNYHKRNLNLQNKLTKLDANSKELQNKAIELNRLGQLGSDLSNTARELLNLDPKLINYDLLDGTVDGLSRTCRNTISAISDFSPVYSSTSASTVSAFTRSFSPENAKVEVDNEYIYLQKYADLSQLSDLIVDKQKAIKLISDFGFGKKNNAKKSPMEHFLTAHDAYEAPVNDSNPVNSSLLPMRSALSEIIEKLLRTRPRQEKTKNNQAKIHSILNQLHRPGLESSAIEDFSIEYDRLINSLSSSKNYNLEREEWRSLLRDSTIFIQALLETIDPNKMKPLGVTYD